MANIVLVTGGARSGKSAYALARAEEIEGRRCFVATCEVLDAEMAERVEKHCRERDSRLWETVEEPLAIASLVEGGDYDIYLIDCLTLWVNNVMAAFESRGESCGEEQIAGEITALIERAANLQGTVLIVSNEVGMGIVPGNALARKYRDLVGICNRLIGEAASEVVLVSCGIPLHIKQ